MRVGELEGLQRELAAAREEQAGTLKELSQSQQQLQASRRETAQLDHEVGEKGVDVELRRITILQQQASWSWFHRSIQEYCNNMVASERWS